LGNLSISNSLHPEAGVEYKKKKRTSAEQADYLMYKVLLSNKLNFEILSKEEVKIVMADGMIPEALRRHDIEVYFERKKYGEINKLYVGEEIKTARIDEKIVYDLSKILFEVEKGTKKPTSSLLCEKQFKKYPEARDSSYSLTICQILLDVKAGKKPNRKNLVILKKLVKKYPSREFLLSATENLYK